ncbi:MAG: hypothetical protein WCC80_19450, partial [Pseudolabrys sp.]
MLRDTDDHPADDVDEDNQRTQTPKSFAEVKRYTVCNAARSPAGIRPSAPRQSGCDWRRDPCGGARVLWLVEQPYGFSGSATIAGRMISR